MDDSRPVVRLLDIRETPLDVGEVLAAVEDAADGGVTLFVGAVRGVVQVADRPVVVVVAHPTALDRLREVAERVAATHPVTALAAVHRVGHLGIGDLAVVVAAGAAHRSEAFDASRALIDELKATVPIWKHQVFADGDEEWVGTP